MKLLQTLTAASLEGIIDHKVIDQGGEPIGTLHSLWSDPATGSVEFLGVKTGWIFGHNHVVPAAGAELEEDRFSVRVPFAAAFIKGAPSIPAAAEITEAQEARIYAYYRGDGPAGDARAAGAERWRRIGRAGE